MKAAILDLDGVLTRTERLHSAAWKRTFDSFLRRAAGDAGGFRPFLESDYRRFVDGKPRQDGVRSFLDSRGIALPDGSAGDPVDAQTIHGLGNRKNSLFVSLLESQGVEVIGASVDAIHAMRKRGMKTALVSSSRNARAVLASAGLTDLFDVIIDGEEAARIGLKGKPDPATFLEAAKRMGVTPADSVVVEDAIAGVEAGHAGGFGWVVGIAEGDAAQALREHGADQVVRDLSMLAEPGGALPDAIEQLAEISQGLRNRSAAVFLDYDGTLTPIVARPDLAILPVAMRSTLETLAELCTIAVISGRDRADVERCVGIKGLVYAGSHGFDIAGPGLRLEHPLALPILPVLDRVEASLRRVLRGIDGVFVERKRFAIAVHYRLAELARVPDIEAAVEELVSNAPELRKSGGKKIFELRPAIPWDKGKAVLWLLEQLGMTGVHALPFYLGDDETDEDAFRALRGLGVCILVGDRDSRTAAQYRIASPEAVIQFLQGLIKIQREGCQ